MRFNREARRLVGHAARGDRRCASSSHEGGYSDYFVERLIVPQASAVWSADPDQMWSFPAALPRRVLRQPRRAQLRGRPAWRTVTGGSRRYVEALIAPFRDRIRLSAPVRAIVRPRTAGRRSGSTAAAERFDEVVLAVALRPGAAHACRPQPTPSARCSARSPTSATRPFCTPTRALLPRRRAAPGELELPPGRRAPRGRTTVTYGMNRLQSLDAGARLLVTLNRTDAIDPPTVIRTIEYAHPVFTPAASPPRARWAEISAASAPTTAAPTGAGDSTRTASGRRCESPKRSADAARSPAR